MSNKGIDKLEDEEPPAIEIKKKLLKKPLKPEPGQSGFAALVTELELPQGVRCLRTPPGQIPDVLNPKEELVDPRTGEAYTKDSFEAGLAVDDEQTLLRPLAPYTYSNAASGIVTKSQKVLPQLIYSFSAHPDDETALLKRKIPTIRERSPDDKKLIEGDYSYSLYTYADVGKVSDLKYVFSGSNDAISGGGYVVPNTFIPLQILETRLCGNSAEREQAYLNDWLTYCSYMIKYEQTKHRSVQRPIGSFLPLAALPKDFVADLQVNPNKPPRYDGSHLRARDTAGGYSAAFGFKFIRYLLDDFKINTLSAEDLSRHIFRRWCAVAYAAAAIEKVPFCVKARFWKIPTKFQSSPPIVLFYEMLAGWWQDPNMTNAGKKVKVSKKLRDDFNHIKNDFNEQKFFSRWEGFMDEVFKAATASANVGLEHLPYKVQPIVPHFRLLKPGQSKQRLQVLGWHPQGYYCTYISNGDVDRMVQAGYTLLQDQRRRFPDVDPDVASAHTTPEPKFTIIRKTYMSNATTWPRTPTQSAVMGFSASDVARSIWALNERDRRTAEWLHRSAYSFGGSGVPDDSQRSDNLVFGTYEANTQMLRYESYLKQLVHRVPDHSPDSPFSVHLVTQTSREGTPGDNGSRLPWLVPRLGYMWYFDINHALNPLMGYDVLDGDIREVKMGVTFDLFSRKYPMRYEVEVDEKFDQMLLEAPPELKVLVAYFLISQCGGVVANQRL